METTFLVDGKGATPTDSGIGEILIFLGYIKHSVVGEFQSYHHPISNQRIIIIDSAQRSTSEALKRTNEKALTLKDGAFQLPRHESSVNGFYFPRRD